MIEKVELLKHHAHTRSNFVDIGFFAVDHLAVNPDFSACRRFKKIQATQESGFSASGGSDNNDFFALFNVIINAFENLKAAEGFSEIFNLYHLLSVSFP